MVLNIIQLGFLLFYLFLYSFHLSLRWIYYIFCSTDSFFNFFQAVVNYISIMSYIGDFVLSGDYIADSAKRECWEVFKYSLNISSSNKSVSLRFYLNLLLLCRTVYIYP